MGTIVYILSSLTIQHSRPILYMSTTASATTTKIRVALLLFRRNIKLTGTRVRSFNFNIAPKCCTELRIPDRRMEKSTTKVTPSNLEGRKARLLTLS